jgi:hypothetical protein
MVWKSAEAFNWGMAWPWTRPDRGRLFEVECECGEIFKIPFDPAEADYDPAEQLLVPLVGGCPRCGLRVEEIEPVPGASPEGRSRA